MISRRRPALRLGEERLVAGGEIRRAEFVQLGDVEALRAERLGDQGRIGGRSRQRIARVARLADDQGETIGRERGRSEQRGTRERETRRRQRS